MSRALLLQSLEAYQPMTDIDKKAKQAIQEFVKNNEDCFERSLSIGHITASSWLLNKDGTKALLMHHAKLNRWVQLGGHCDGDSDVLAVAVKEAQEESGIESIEPVSYEIFDIDVHLIPANAKEPEHYHYDIRFLLQVTSDEDFIKNHESKDMRWFGKDKQMFPTKSPSVVRMLDKWIALKSVRLQ